MNLQIWLLANHGGFPTLFASDRHCWSLSNLKGAASGQDNELSVVGGTVAANLRLEKMIFDRTLWYPKPD